MLKFHNFIVATVRMISGIDKFLKCLYMFVRHDVIHKEHMQMMAKVGHPGYHLKSKQRFSYIDYYCAILFHIYVSV